ncbi:MAG: glycosyltransferase family 39 protein [Anaerolineales bacterium]|nr:glycosyltransferase family 39 protein [Anaerolineales bacterium]
MAISLRKRTLYLAAILAAALTCALAYAFGFRIAPMVDARWYDTIGWNLAQGGGFRLVEGSALAEDPAIAVVGPGYPYFLAVIYRLLGHHLEPVWIVQSLLHALNALLVFHLASKVLGESEDRDGLALLAAALYGFNPDLIQIAAMLFTETLYLTLILLAAAGMVRFADSPTAKAALGTAVLLAAAILVRPIAILALAVLLLLLAVKKKWILLPAAAAAAVLLVGIWTARNCAVYGRCVLLTAAGGYDLWVGNNPDSLGEQLVTPEINQYLSEHGFLETDRHGTEMYFQYMLSDPGGFLGLQMVKTAKFFSALRTSAWWFHLSGISRLVTFLLSAPFYFFYLAVGGAGWISALRKGPAAARIAALLALIVPAAAIPITVTSRLRYPMYPFLAALSVLAILRLRRGEIPRRQFLAAGGFAAAATVADLILSAPQIPERIVQLFQ